MLIIIYHESYLKIDKSRQKQENYVKLLMYFILNPKKIGEFQKNLRQVFHQDFIANVQIIGNLCFFVNHGQ